MGFPPTFMRQQQILMGYTIRRTLRQKPGRSLSLYQMEVRKMKKVSVFLVLLLMVSFSIVSQSASSSSLVPDRPIVMDGTIKVADGDLLRSGVVWYEKANDNANQDALNYT